MKKLMKLAAMAVCVGTMLGITGCGNGNSPESVAVENISAFMKGMGGEEAASLSYKVSKSEIKEDKGVVYVDIYDNGKKEHTEKVRVFKEDGVWKVGFNKEDKELENAALFAKSCATSEREKLGIKSAPVNQSYFARVLSKEKKGDSVYVTIEMCAGDDEKVYDTAVIEMKKIGKEWKPVYKK